MTALRPEAWESNVATVVALAARDWHPGDPFDLQAETTRLCWTLCGTTLFGRDNAAIKPLLEVFCELQRIVDSPRWLGGVGISKRTTTCVEALRAELEARVASLLREPDIESFAADGPARALLSAGHPRPVIIDTVISFLTVGATTLAGGLAWALLECAANQSHWRHCAHDPDQEWLQAVVHEVLRLHNPATIIARVTTSETKVGSVLLPAGQRVVVCPPHASYLSHHSSPSEFRPERWADSENVDGFEPFGTGPRRCPGAAASVQVVASALAAIASRVTLDVPPGPWRSTGLVSNFPQVAVTLGLPLTTEA